MCICWCRCRCVLNYIHYGYSTDQPKIDRDLPGDPGAMWWEPPCRWHGRPWGFAECLVAQGVGGMQIWEDLCFFWGRNLWRTDVKSEKFIHTYSWFMLLCHFVWNSFFEMNSFSPRKIPNGWKMIHFLLGLNRPIFRSFYCSFKGG